MGDDVALEIGKPMQKYFYFIQLVQYSDCQSIYQRDWFNVIARTFSFNWNMLPVQITTEDTRLVTGEIWMMGQARGETGHWHYCLDLQLADGTGHCHCRRIQASHWSEAGHSWLRLAGGAWGWIQLSLTDLSDCITPGNPPTLTRWRQFWFWQEV